PPEGRRQRRIEPDDFVGLFEDRRSEPRPVVAVDDPAVAATERRPYPRAQLFDRRLDPARLPVERIELDVWDAEPLRQRAREGGLPRPGAADHRDLLRALSRRCRSAP